MSKVITEDQMIEALHAYVRSFDSQSMAANAIGISQAYLCDILKGRRQISNNIANHLGYERKLTYESIES